MQPYLSKMLEVTSQVAVYLWTKHIFLYLNTKIFCQRKQNTQWRTVALIAFNIPNTGNIKTYPIKQKELGTWHQNKDLCPEFWLEVGGNYWMPQPKLCKSCDCGKVGELSPCTHHSFFWATSEIPPHLSGSYRINSQWRCELRWLPSFCGNFKTDLFLLQSFQALCKKNSMNIIVYRLPAERFHEYPLLLGFHMHDLEAVFRLLWSCTSMWEHFDMCLKKQIHILLIKEMCLDMFIHTQQLTILSNQ